MQSEPAINIIKENKISIMHVSSADNNNSSLFRNCYYFKNLDNNLIVLSLLVPDSKADYENINKIVKSLISTFKLIEKKKPQIGKST